MDPVSLKTLAGIAGVLCEKDEPIIILTTDNDHLMVTASAGCEHEVQDTDHTECKALLVTMLVKALAEVSGRPADSAFYTSTKDGTITADKE